MLLWEHNEMTVNQIAEKLILNTNTVTPLLKRMETDGILSRVQSQQDQRKVLVSLTEKGLRMQEEAAQIPFNLLSRLNVSMELEKVNEALELKNRLYKLIGILEKIE
jgi:DNA-binding MarR family transcriptional regulator